MSAEQTDEVVRHRRASAPDLVVNVEGPIPRSLPTGSGTAIFCCGTCFHRHEAIDRLEIVVDGVRHRPTAFGMPRPDVFRWLHPDPIITGSRSEPVDLSSAEDPGVRSYHSGFWSTVPIEARDRPGTVELQLAVRLANRVEQVVALGQIEIVEDAPIRPFERTRKAPHSELIAVCMATFEPDMALFGAQIDSLRAQTDDRWICVVSDDCSSPECFVQIRRVVGDDPRFVVSRTERRLGFYRNFERALAMAPAEAELLALCDQDDRWHPEKLEVLRDALGSAQLVYSDQRLVDARGRVLRDTLWKGRRNNHTNLASLLIANTISSAAVLFRREVAERAVPFPETPGLQFHDHWLGLVALATGDVAYVDRPLYDYVQHDAAVFGEVSPGPAEEGAVRHRRGRRAIPRAWRAPWRGGRSRYFLGYVGRDVQAQTLLVRFSEGLTASKRRALQRFVESDHSPADFAWLAARALRGLVGRNETLGTEIDLARGILWRWLVDLGARRSRMPGRMPWDASFPDAASFQQRRVRRWRAVF